LVTGIYRKYPNKSSTQLERKFLKENCGPAPVNNSTLSRSKIHPAQSLILTNRLDKFLNLNYVKK